QWIIARHCSAAAARLIVGAMGLLTVLTLVAFLPVWGWWNGSARSFQGPRAADTTSPVKGPFPSAEGSEAEAAEMPRVRLDALLLHIAPRREPESAGRFWQILAGVYLAGATIALLRLLLGLIEVASLRRKSVPINDHSLRQLAAGLASELGSPHVEVRE